MKLLTYKCDSCEDTEKYDEVLVKWARCECGGHLYLVKQDNFLINHVVECDICLKKGTDDCIDCIRGLNEIS